MKLNKLFAGMMLSGAMMLANAADITVAYDADPVSMDPMEQLSGGTLQMANLIFDPLVRYDHELNVEPRLAEKWEQVDDKTTRFHLRKGVKFHSGNDMTADDVVWSFNRLLKSADFKGLYAPYEKMVKVDDHTVDLIVKDVYPTNLMLGNMSYLFVMDSKFYTGQTDDGKDKSAVEKNVGSFASTNESGTGVFKLESRQQGVKSVYVKFKDYWGKSGNVDKVTLVPIKENATRVSALLSGDVDMIAPVAPTDLEQVEKAKGYELYTIPSDRIITFQLNQDVAPEFKNKKVRQAVVYAINNEGIVKKIMRGFGTAAAQNSIPGYQGHNASLKPRYDLAKAKELMKEAGYENGFKVTMIAPNNRYVNDEKIAQAAAAMLAKIGIKAELTTMPKAQYWPLFDERKNGIQMIGWSSDTGDSANFSEFLTMTRNEETGAGQYNSGNFSNPELDKLVIEANKTLDADKRSALLQEASKIEFDDAAFVPLHWQNLAWGYTSKFKNFPETVNFKNFPLLGDLVVEE